MMKVAAWNIRGLNALIKQKEVSEFIRLHGISICCIVESRVQQNNMVDVCKHVFGRWEWISNALVCDQGTRIICAWDPSVLTLMVVDSGPQFINCEARIVGEGEPVFFSFVYGRNKGVERRELWDGLRQFNLFTCSRAWVVLGDFNTMLFPHDGIGGSSRRNSDMEEFNE